MAAAQQIPLAHVDRSRNSLAARAVYACIVLGTVADTEEGAQRFFESQRRTPIAELREYVAALERELREAGKPTLGEVAP